MRFVLDSLYYLRSKKSKSHCIILVIFSHMACTLSNNTNESKNSSFDKLPPDSINAFVSNIAPAPFEITIGSQTWMSKNLDVDTFRNGDSIPQAKSEQEWLDAMKSGKPAWCYYENDERFGLKYGKLYNYYALSDPRGLAPLGWRIPGIVDFYILVDSLGGEKIAGNKLKSVYDWNKDRNGTNQTGFNALPGGIRTFSYNPPSTNFDRLHDCASYWSVTKMDHSSSREHISVHALDLLIGGQASFDTPRNTSTGDGLYIRCIKETPEDLFVNPKITEVVIGSQVWMSSNLNVDRFRNGDIIMEAKTNAEWKRAETRKQPAWCYYYSDFSFGRVYGKLYNWYAVNDPRLLAPAGWHIPTAKECNVLQDELGGGRQAGHKIKSKIGYRNGENGDNSSGFNALPGGYRIGGGDATGLFLYSRYKGVWWTASTHNKYKDNAFIFDSDFFSCESYEPKACGHSVRCVKD